MNKKQKKNLQRIIIALILVLILKLLPQFPTPVELVLYCIPYLVIIANGNTPNILINLKEHPME